MQFIERTSRARRGAIAAVSAFAVFWAFPQAARAQVSGFGNGSGFTLNTNGNGTPNISNDVLTITTGGGALDAAADDNGQANSVYFNTKQSISAWTASFVYQDVTGGGADGFTFVLQNQGVNALGLAGGALGYGGQFVSDEGEGGGEFVGGIMPSAAIQFNIYGPNGGSSTGFQTNGEIGYDATGNVDITRGNPVLVSLAYDGTTLSETLTDQTTSDVFSTAYTTDLNSVLGASTAFVGFTGGTGGSTAQQTIRNFVFSPAAVGAPEPGSFALLGTGIVPLAGLAVRKRGRRANKTAA